MQYAFFFLTIGGAACGFLGLAWQRPAFAALCIVWGLAGAVLAVNHQGVTARIREDMLAQHTRSVARGIPIAWQFPVWHWRITGGTMCLGCLALLIAIAV